MAKITIIVQGIAISYHKNDGLWKILFPFGDSHLIKFKETLNDNGLSLAKSNRYIRITAENAESSFAAGDNYKDFLDLTDEYSHSNGVRLKEDWEEKAVLMSVENAKFSVHKYTDYEHFMLKDTVVTSVPRKMGYSGKFEIISESITVHVDDHPEFPKVFDADCTLIFDNDCYDDKPKTRGDFEMVYNVIEDSQNSARQFTVAAVPDNRDESISPGATFIPQTEEAGYRDPLNKGLPCHLVKISKTESLL
jgi:hypothetical protein